MHQRFVVLCSGPAQPTVRPTAANVLVTITNELMHDMG